MEGARDNLLHIETEGGIVNVRVGLRDRDGRPVTSVEIIPDQYAGETWELDGYRNNRLLGPNPETEREERLARIADVYPEAAEEARRAGK
jgi:hypothetical protein